MNQGQTTGISTANRALGGTSGFGLDEIISNAPYPSASSSKRYWLKWQTKYACLIYTC